MLQQLSISDWFWLLLSAAMIGSAKAGIKGMGMLAIPIMATVFGGKVSAGLVLPMLSMADLLAVRYYNRDADWSYIWKLLPAAALGVLLGVWVGYYIDDDTFKVLMGIIVIGSLALMLIQEKRGLPPAITQSYVFGAIFGLLGGFSTMIGNAAGPIMSVYLLAVLLPKNSFIGTGAWFFLIINLFKFPFHIFIWKTITWESFTLDLLTLPAIVLGVWIGIKVIKFIPEKEFRYFVIVMTLIAAVRLFY